MGKDPSDVACEWCGESSTVCIERERPIKGKSGSFVKVGMFIYACNDHRKVAEDNRIIRRR